jgi:hypothetical protein
VVKPQVENMKNILTDQCALLRHRAVHHRDDIAGDEQLVDRNLVGRDIIGSGQYLGTVNGGAWRGQWLRLLYHRAIEQRGVLQSPTIERVRNEVYEFE